MNKFVSILLLLFFSGCDSEPGLQVSLGSGNGNHGDGNGGSGGKISIAELKSMYSYAPVRVDTELSVSGYVVSSDNAGNFYKTVYIQDHSGGVALRVDMYQTFTLFRFGSIITINCNSLCIGSYGGEIQLGYSSAAGNYQVDPIPEAVIHSYVSFDYQVGEEFSPATITIDEVSMKYVNCLVKLDDVQFVEGENWTTWCDEGENYTERLLEDRYGNVLVVRTSGYASFADHALPSGSGSIMGVLSYFNGDYYLMISFAAHASTMRNERF